MSSTMASASSSTLRPAGTLVPTMVMTPTAMAMSVAIGIAHPSRAAGSWTMAKKTRTGTIIPPAAAATGAHTLRPPRSSPATTSRLISIPTTKKKITIRPSLTQCLMPVSRWKKPRSMAMWWWMKFW